MDTIKERGRGFQILPNRCCKTKILGRRGTYEVTLRPLRSQPADGFLSAVPGTRVRGHPDELRRQQSPGRALERVMEEWRPKAHMWIPRRPLAEVWAMHGQGKTTKAFRTVAATGLRGKWESRGQAVLENTAITAQPERRDLFNIAGIQLRNQKCPCLGISTQP